MKLPTPKHFTRFDGYLGNRERQQEADASDERQRQLYRWTARVGFNEQQAPYAAVVASAMKFKRQGGAVYPSEVRDRLLTTHPFLFRDKAQLGLFGEEAL